MAHWGYGWGAIMVRHFVVCCDGTWNTAEQASVTNVRRLYNSLAETSEDGTEQKRYYHPGVGTEDSLFNWLLGGSTGAGLSRYVLDAYRWLITSYQPGDRIALFGFSRGAYTVRSLAGLIAACGLLDTTDLDPPAVERQMKRVYRLYQQGWKDPRWREGLRFTFDPERPEQIPVHFIGVWDTVGALGIPDTLGWLNLLDPAYRHNFHDLKLNPYVRHARHAVALDEFRGPYVPALWPEPAPPGQDVKQVWFPGSHQDVGGGHGEIGLSDGALKWMIDEARGTVELAFHESADAQIRPDADGVIHDDNRAVLGPLEPLFGPLFDRVLEPLFQPRPRAVPRIDPDAPKDVLAESVLVRAQRPPITSGPYRPTRTLAAGESATVEVLAYEPWNDTGLYLEAGDYTFVADGQWRDRSTWAGPAGITGLGQLNPAQPFRLLGTLIGRAEKLFRQVTGNEMASFLFSRREEDMPWMALLGVVANDAVVVNGDQAAHQQLAIGEGADYRVRKSGYLYAFANDAWGFYGSNRGSVRLTVTRNG